jgi:hypothetical protein
MQLRPYRDQKGVDVGCGRCIGDQLHSAFPKIEIQDLWLFIQHSIITDDPDATQLWRLKAALADPALKGLEGSKGRYGAGAVIGFGLDEMDEAVVVEPQRKIANAFGPRRFQFREYIGDQFGVPVRHIGFCLIPDQGPFHHSLQRLVFEDLFLMACSCVLDVRDGAKDSVAKKIFKENT